MKLTKEQRKALKRVWDRSVDYRLTWGNHYLPYRRSVFLAFGDVAMVKWCGMVLGIEPDGHTHS